MLGSGFWFGLSLRKTKAKAKQVPAFRHAGLAALGMIIWRVRLGTNLWFIGRHGRCFRTRYDYSSKSKVMGNIGHRNDVVGALLLNAQRFQKCVSLRFALAHICFPRIMGFR